MSAVPRPTVINIGDSGAQAVVWIDDDDKDLVGLTYWGDATALVAAGFAPDMVRPGRRGKRRVDSTGAPVRVSPMNNHWTRVRIDYRNQSLEHAMTLPGMSVAPLLERFRPGLQGTIAKLGAALERIERKNGAA